jgi:hypothetical protein
LTRVEIVANRGIIRDVTLSATGGPSHSVPSLLPPEERLKRTNIAKYIANESGEVR